MTKPQYEGSIFSTKNETKPLPLFDGGDAAKQLVAQIGQLPVTPKETLAAWKANLDDMDEQLGPGASPTLKRDLADARRHLVTIEGFLRGKTLRHQAGAMQAAMSYGYKLGVISVRASGIERAAGVGKTQIGVGKKAAADKQKDAFSITREQLLEVYRSQYKRFRCNQKELSGHVAKHLKEKAKPTQKVPGAHRIHQLMKEHCIFKADYAEK